MLRINYNDISFGCFECRYLDEDYSTCPAYPEGIPEELLTGRVWHKEIRNDQLTDIVFAKSQHITQRFDRILALRVFKSLSDEYQKSKNESYKNGLMFAIRQIIKLYKIKKPTN